MDDVSEDWEEGRVEFTGLVKNSELNTSLKIYISEISNDFPPFSDVLMLELLLLAIMIVSTSHKKLLSWFLIFKNSINNKPTIIFPKFSNFFQLFPTFSNFFGFFFVLFFLSNMWNP